MRDHASCLKTFFSETFPFMLDVNEPQTENHLSFGYHFSLLKKNNKNLGWFYESGSTGHNY